MASKGASESTENGQSQPNAGAENEAAGTAAKTGFLATTVGK